MMTTASFLVLASSGGGLCFVAPVAVRSTSRVSLHARSLVTLYEPTKVAAATAAEEREAAHHRADEL